MIDSHGHLVNPFRCINCDEKQDIFDTPCTNCGKDKRQKTDVIELPCGHWNKDWEYGEGELRSVCVKAFCRDCKTEVDVAPQDKAEKTLKEEGKPI